MTQKNIRRYGEDESARGEVDASKVPPGKKSRKKPWTKEEDSYLRHKFSAWSNIEACASFMALDGVFEGNGRTEEQIKQRLMTLGLRHDVVKPCLGRVGGRENDGRGNVLRVRPKRSFDLRFVRACVKELQPVDENLVFLRENVESSILYRSTNTAIKSVYAIVPRTNAEFALLQNVFMERLMKALRFCPPTRSHRFWTINAEMYINNEVSILGALRN